MLSLSPTLAPGSDVSCWQGVGGTSAVNGMAFRVLLVAMQAD